MAYDASMTVTEYEDEFTRLTLAINAAEIAGEDVSALNKQLEDLAMTAFDWQLSGGGTVEEPMDVMPVEPEIADTPLDPIETPVLARVAYVLPEWMLS